MKSFKISIQVSNGGSWSKIDPVFHDVESRHEGIAVAYAISKQLGYITVRLVEVPDTLEALTPPKQREYVCNLSGVYILATRPLAK